MNKAFLVLAIVALPTLAWAGEWQYLTEDNASNVLYINTASIQAVGKLKKVWFKQVMHELTPVPGSLSSYKFELVLANVDCSARTMGYARLIKYGEDEVTILNSVTSKVKPDDMIDQVPNSLGARMVDAVCSASKRRR